MSNINNISGEYIPTPLSKVLYGRGTIQSLPALLSELNAKKAFIVTGSSLHSKTPVIKQIEQILGDKFGRTYSKIAQHAPVQAIKEAVEDAKKTGVDVFISVGGGSPIDSVKGTQSSLPPQAYLGVFFSGWRVDCSYYS
jgi:alcohol dehydrogenase class IV